MSKDKVGASDHVEAGIIAEVTPPKHPCPVCKKESKADNVFQDGPNGRPEPVPGARICSNKSCREKFNLFDA